MSKIQPWKDAISDQDVAAPSTSNDNPADLFGCTGFKVQKLEKLVLDTQKQLDSVPEGRQRTELEKIVRDAQKELNDPDSPDLFRCSGFKVQKLEKLVLDSQTALDANPEAADGASLERIRHGAEKELDGSNREDLFRCQGFKTVKLEKLILDTKTERDAAPEADHEYLDGLIADAQKELGGGAEKEVGDAKKELDANPGGQE